MRIKDFFYMNKNDRKVIVVLLAVAVMVAGLFYMLGGHDDVTPLGEADSLAVEKSWEKSRRSYSKNDEKGRANAAEKRPVELFVFDPNTATSDELLRLGLEEWQVKNIMKYRSRGGIYRKPADFAKLYGLTVEKFKQLEPYLRFTADHRPASELFALEKSTEMAERPDRKADSLRFPTRLREGERLTLDQMDTTSLKRVPGIGSFFARRIVEYSQRLGGFVRVEQLLEVDGIPEDVLDYFTEGSGNVRKLNLNTLTLNQLKRHPYINFYQARAIVDRRRLHGVLKSLDDLRLLPEFHDEAINRLKPYVEF